MRKSMMFGTAFGLALLTASSAFAQLAEKKVITWPPARKMVAAAEAEAERNHWAARHRRGRRTADCDRD